MPSRFFFLFLTAAFLMWAGCATADDEALEGAPPPVRSAEPEGFPGGRAAPDVRTVQLHRTGSEGALPVIGLGSGQTLTLAFDRLDRGVGGPVSVYFYHADRQWNRRLLAVEYLRGFQSDEIRTYRPSAGTRVGYTHYTYRFPNANIAFTRSGNFFIRVTELGDEQAVLFERAFYVTEGTAEVALSVQRGLGTVQEGPIYQPLAQVRPPARFDAPLFDYDVCFARDGRLALVRCSGEPTLMGAALYQFYLPRERSFGQAEPRYELDLSVLGAGPQVTAVDLSATPYRITLAPDDARFTPLVFDDALRTGQPLVEAAVRGLGEPNLQAEYAEVTFRYIPAGREPVGGRVILTGSFNDWALDRANALRWNEAEGMYEGTLLLKQGRYAYTYYMESRAERERRREVDRGQPSLYTAFVYVHEPGLNTDRLLAVQSYVGP